VVVVEGVKRNAKVVRSMSAVRVGDMVEVAGGGTARVACVVEIERPASKEMVRFDGGLEITPRHPLRLEGKWRRPRDMCEACDACEQVTGQGLERGCATAELVTMESDYHVYNLVLEGEGKGEGEGEGGQTRVLLVNGLECATWGHGLKGDPVVEHEYFGSERILRDLEAMDGYAEGRVYLRDGSFIRERGTGEVCRVVQLFVPKAVTALGGSVALPKQPQYEPDETPRALDMSHVKDPFGTGDIQEATRTGFGA